VGIVVPPSVFLSGMIHGFSVIHMATRRAALLVLIASALLHFVGDCVRSAKKSLAELDSETGVDDDFDGPPLAHPAHSLLDKEDMPVNFLAPVASHQDAQVFMPFAASMAGGNNTWLNPFGATVAPPNATTHIKSGNDSDNISWVTTWETLDALNSGNYVMKDGRLAHAPNRTKYTRPASMKEILLALGGSSGLNYDFAGNTAHARQALREMRYQHAAATILILAVFCGFLGTSLSMVYYQVQQRFRESAEVKFYADLGTEVGLEESSNIDDFLHTFDRAPSSTRLVVTGLQPVDGGDPLRNEHGFIWYHGEVYRVSFSFSLDLTSWVASNQHSVGERIGMAPDDRDILRTFLETNNNDMASVELQKEVIWKGWEDLATNIKTRLRERGFHGTVQVHCEGSECLTVRKNTPWGHFMRNRLTKALIALSIVGWGFFELYIWIKSTKLVVKSTHHIQMPIDEYWQLIEDKLSSDGFSIPGDDLTRPPPLAAHRDEPSSELLASALTPVPIL